MLRKLFPQRRSRSAAPLGDRLYAIGDIHGRADLLDDILEKIDKDASGLDNATLIFLGDYVDRGPASSQVIDRLISLRTDFDNAVFLKGNHEAAMVDFLNDPEDMHHWLNWGGEQTLESYGIAQILARSPQSIGAEFNDVLPTAHRAFVDGLKLSHRAGDYFFVHAGVRPGIALDDQKEEDLLWIRKHFHNTSRDERPDATIVHGHQAVKKAEDHGWRINVDSSAYRSDKLTAVALVGDQRRFITT